MTTNELMVEGEPARLLVQAMQTMITDGDVQDGMFHYEGVLDGDSGAALLHALGRVTAELHAQDIRSFLPGGSRNVRTDDQRRSDAFVLLLRRLRQAYACAI